MKESSGCAQLRAELSPRSFWVEGKILSPLASCQSSGLFPRAGLGTASPHLHAPRSANHKVEAILYKRVPGRSSTFLTPSSMDYLFHLPCLLAPFSSVTLVLKGSRAETQGQSQELEKKQIEPTLLSSLQSTGLRHPPGKSFEKNIHRLCPSLNTLHLDKVKEIPTLSQTQECI